MYRGEKEREKGRRRRLLTEVVERRQLKRIIRMVKREGEN